MRKIGAYELKTHLSEVLDAVEHGQTVVVTRHGRPIARISPDAADQRQQASQAVQSLLNFPRIPLPKGVTVRSLIEEGRR
jgi:prevent-host-death family protein